MQVTDIAKFIIFNNNIEGRWRHAEFKYVEDKLAPKVSPYTRTGLISSLLKSNLVIKAFPFHA